MKESTNKVLALLKHIEALAPLELANAQAAVTELDEELDAAIAAHGEALNSVARQRSENEAEAARLEQLKRDLQATDTASVESPQFAELTEKLAQSEGLVSELSEANAALQAEVAGLRREITARDEATPAADGTPDDVPLGVSVPDPLPNGGGAPADSVTA